MIGSLITRINKYLVYLEKKELLPDKNGATQLCSRGYRDSESYEIKDGCGVKHVWDVSYHNGDYSNYQVLPMSNTELIRLLESMEKEYRSEVEQKIKHELEIDAVRRRMVELGLLDGFPLV